MKYVTYDESGNLTGAFDQEMPQDHDGNFIEVSEDIRLNWNNYIANADRDGVELAPPTPIVVVVPRSITMRQARTALLNAGLLDTVDGLIAGMPEDAGKKARIDWDYSSEMMRDWPLVNTLAPALGLSSSQLDDLFIAAGKL
jgi:hypothetical protein